MVFARKVIVSLLVLLAPCVPECAGSVGVSEVVEFTPPGLPKAYTWLRHYSVFPSRQRGVRPKDYLA